MILFLTTQHGPTVFYGTEAEMEVLHSRGYDPQYLLGFDEENFRVRRRGPRPATRRSIPRSHSNKLAVRSAADTINWDQGAVTGPLYLFVCPSLPGQRVYVGEVEAYEYMAASGYFPRYLLGFNDAELIVEAAPSFGPIARADPHGLLYVDRLTSSRAPAPAPATPDPDPPAPPVPADLPAAPLHFGPNDGAIASTDPTVMTAARLLRRLLIHLQNFSRGCWQRSGYHGFVTWGPDDCCQLTVWPCQQLREVPDAAAAARENHANFNFMSFYRWTQGTGLLITAFTYSQQTDSFMLKVMDTAGIAYHLEINLRPSTEDDPRSPIPGGLRLHNQLTADMTLAKAQQVMQAYYMTQTPVTVKREARSIQLD